MDIANTIMEAFSAATANETAPGNKTGSLDPISGKVL